MTRGKKLSVVFAVVLLVVASGTALAMAASSNQANATNSAQAAQETTEAATQTGQAEETASVSLSDQESEGTVITVDSATLPEGGFVAIHDETLLDGDAVGSVIGVSRYLDAGTHEDVRIVLDRPVSETQTLIAMPHQDTNENQAYGFTISEGNVDGAYTSGGAPVVSNAEITVSGEATTEAADGEVTETETVADEPATETEEPVTEEPVTEEPTEVSDGDEEETTEVAETEMPTEAPVTEEPATEEPATEEPTEPGEAQVPSQLVFRIENVEIEEWSFVVGDSTEPDRTEVIEGGTLTDRTVELNLTELAQGESTVNEAMGREMAQQTTPETPEAGDLNASDVETVRYVIRNVDIENVTFVVTGLEQLQEMEELPDGVPTEVPATTEVEDDDEFETTEVEETTEAVETEEVTEVEETTEVVEETEEVTEVEETTEAVEETEQVTEVEETTEAEEPTEVEETTQAGGTQSFGVENLQAPQTASAGDVITVSATVTNPGDVENTEEVDFRIQGDVIDSQTVTLDAGESREVTFEVDTSQLQAGDYVQGVYGDQRGQVALITIGQGGEAATETGEETADAGATTEAEATTEVVEQQIAVQITA